MVDRKIFDKRKITKLEKTVAEKLFLEHKIVGAVGKLAQNKENVTDRDALILKAKENILLLLKGANKLGVSSLKAIRDYEPVVLLEKEGLIEILPSNNVSIKLTRKGWNWLESLKR